MDERMREALLRVLTGQIPEGDDEVVLDYATSQWMVAQAEKAQARLKERIMRLSEAGFRSVDGIKTVLAQKRLPYQAEAVKHLLESLGFDPNAAMDQVAVPSPVKIESLVHHGVLTEAQVGQISRASVYPKVTTPAGVKAALGAIFNAPQWDNTDED